MITFFVPGTPRPKGSTKSFWNPKAKKIVSLRASDHEEAWESRVTQASLSAGCKGTADAVVVWVTCWLSRPRSHWNAKGLKPSAPKFPTGKPDADKLLRAILDGLTAVAYLDDSQVVQAIIQKVYATADHPSGATVSICDKEHEGS